MVNKQLATAIMTQVLKPTGFPFDSRSKPIRPPKIKAASNLAILDSDNGPIVSTNYINASMVCS